MSGGSGIEAARDARDRHDWQACFDLTSELLAPRAGGDGDATASAGADMAELLDLRAESAWWLGRLDDCIDAREGAYRIYEELEDAKRAGQCAVWLYEHHCFRASPSIANAWLARARRALRDAGDCSELGALLLREAEMAHGGGSLDAAAELCERGIELGRRLHLVDLEAEGLQALGRVRIDQGDPLDGLALLDEAMLFAVEGRLSPYSTGKVYCSLISACEELSDHRRAAEWTLATSRWAEGHPHAVFPGLCRVHHATALQQRGDLAEAEREAARACEELAGINLPNAAAAFAEIGDIRRRLGDLVGAADAFASADRLCPQPRAVVALLRLAQGQLDEATTIVQEALEAAGWNRLARAKVLPAVAQIAIAAGKPDKAAAAVDELDAISSQFGSEGLMAAALSARGRVQIAQDDPAACATLRSAASHWNALGVPYEEATARVLLAEAHRTRGDERAAATAFAAARQLFDGLGVHADEPSAGRPRSATKLPAGLTEREAEVVRLVAAGHTNKEIAGALFLSDKTVARHLSNVFTKIGVSTRAAATAFAFEHGLVRTTRETGAR